jgi:translation initiation factor IF-2
MTETKNTGDKTLTVAPTKTLTLEASGRAGRRASELLPWPFEGGRGREGEAPHDRRSRPAPAGRRASRNGRGSQAGRARRADRAPVVAKPRVAAPEKKPAAPRAQTGVVLRTLTEEEREARARALVDARSREEEDRKRQEAEARARAEREAAEKAEREAAEARKREEDARRQHELESKRKSEEEAKRRLAGGEPAPAPSVVRRPAAAAPSAGATVVGRSSRDRVRPRPPAATRRAASCAGRSCRLKAPPLPDAALGQGGRAAQSRPSHRRLGDRRGG